jgi:hypothetical protein
MVNLLICLSFRTMKKNSHELRATIQKLNKSDGPLFKIEHDPQEY